MSLRDIQPTEPRPHWCPVCGARGGRWWVVLIPAQRVAAWQCADCHHIRGVDTPPGK